jgi:hypothetical protein
MQLNTEFREALFTPSDHELFACGTVETTPFYPWDCIVEGKLHRSEYFFQRDPRAGAVTLVGMRLWGSSNVPTSIAPLNCKFVFHPFGRTLCQGLSADVFREAISASEKCGAYGTLAAMKACVAKHAILDPARYPDRESRAALLAYLQKKAGKARICSSVAIIVWQRYFELLHPGGGAKASEAIVQDILRWMPLTPNNATPSRMVKALTRNGWLFRDDLSKVLGSSGYSGGSSSASEKSDVSLSSAEDDGEELGTVSSTSPSSLTASGKLCAEGLDTGGETRLAAAGC